MVQSYRDLYLAQLFLGDFDQESLIFNGLSVSYPYSETCKAHTNFKEGGELMGGQCMTTSVVKISPTNNKGLIIYTKPDRLFFGTEIGVDLQFTFGTNNRIIGFNSMRGVSVLGGLPGTITTNHLEDGSILIYAKKH